jgi:monofunctional biosynthetic peptidoglycan transglycosylase
VLIRWLIRLVKFSLLFVAALYLFWISSLVLLKYIDPPTTGVQIQRYIEAKIDGKPYHKKIIFKPLSQISVQLQHAVIASEDGRFYIHHGVDWIETQKVADESQENGKLGRGASTITQQLVKNLFFTTHRNPVRKAFEYTLAPLADTILGKHRELELYLNIVEWGPGVWGAEAASQYHYHMSAAKLDREEAARLAACLPSPRRRRPARMNDMSASIMDRMRMMNW